MISGAISKVGSFFSSRVGVAVGIGALALGVCLVAYRFFSMREQKAIAEVTVQFPDRKVRKFKFDYTSYLAAINKRNVTFNENNFSDMITDRIFCAVQQGTFESDSNLDSLQSVLSDLSSSEQPAVQDISHLNNATQREAECSCQVRVVYR